MKIVDKKALPMMKKASAYRQRIRLIGRAAPYEIDPEYAFGAEQWQQD